VTDGRDDRLTLVEVLGPDVVCSGVERCGTLACCAVEDCTHFILRSCPRRLSPARDVCRITCPYPIHLFPQEVLLPVEACLQQRDHALCVCVCVCVCVCLCVCVCVCVLV
jgi:hypothetical protein